MSDLVKDIHSLRFYHTSNETMKDKDILKNQAYQKYSRRVHALYTIPLVFQCWQIGLINKPERASVYRKVRMYKIFTLFASTVFALNHKSQLEKEWTYINRLYPEPTELQKTLYKEA
jgi:hypothetical protein